MIKTFIDRYQKLKRSVNIAELLELIHYYNISAQHVCFVSNFSITPSNNLIEEVYASDHDIFVMINLSKLTIFAGLQHYYNQADKNDQMQIINALNQGTSLLLHQYFYGLYPEFNQIYDSSYQNGQVIYYQHDTNSLSIATLVTSLQYALSEYGVSFSVQSSKCLQPLKPYYINQTSYLNACYLQGVKNTTKALLKIVVSVPRFNQYIIENIQKIISNNAYFQRMQNLIKIDLTIKLNEVNHKSFLPLSCGKDILNSIFRIQL
ncbi:type VI secretion system baseplate protein IglJ [Cysteiniphilum halobium]|uniref:type VI secretion system baseplate protein IglJ n=1 Tax=Cysteiniphilum halobium TaxID=2219059 RepID=UPI003F82B400